MAIDPAVFAADATVTFIGRVRSAWTSRADCPKNRMQALERGATATVEVDALYRDGLLGLERASHIVILSWLDRSARDIIVQKPGHAPEPRGVFALRSPARPNPIGLHVARLVALDAGAGLLTLDAIDVLDGTPVIDIKPYFASIDSIPEATIGGEATT